MPSPGRETTEYRIAEKAATWRLVGTILGVLVVVGGAVVQTTPAGSTAAIIAGAVVAVASIATKTFVDLGYINKRTELKKAEVEANGGKDTPLKNM